VEQQLIEWISRFSYPAVLLLLASTGVGLPVSEDVVLLTAGTICSTGHAWFVVMMPVAWLGVLCGDTLAFRIGRKLGPKAMDHPRLKKVLTPERVARLKARFDRYGLWTIFIARFLPGVRLPTFVLAGSMGITQRRFWQADAAAAAIFAPLLVTLGWRFGSDALPYVRAFGGWALAVIAAVVVVALVVSRLRRAPSAQQP
jgi:membrane protein DedA with SNARE-associated domain